MRRLRKQGKVKLPQPAMCRAFLRTESAAHSSEWSDDREVELDVDGVKYVRKLEKDIELPHTVYDRAESFLAEMRIPAGEHTVKVVPFDERLQVTRNADNWAHRIADAVNLTVDGVTSLAGHDGVHVNGCCYPSLSARNAFPALCSSISSLLLPAAGPVIDKP